METDLVLLLVEEGVATITLNRPETYNAITPQMNLQFRNALMAAQADQEAKVLVLTGSGKAFCAGGDLDTLASLENEIAMREFIHESGRTAALLYRMNKPVIAMVNGIAAGAGFNIALLADLVLCSNTARFAQSFIKIGLIPDWGGHFLLPRAVGLHKAKELMFTADFIDAQEALKLGLVNRVAEDDQLKKLTDEYARRLRDAAPAAIRFMKELLRQSEHLEFDEILALETDAQTYCLGTEDCHEGIKAFREKHPPKFGIPK